MGFIFCIFNSVYSSTGVMLDLPNSVFEFNNLTVKDTVINGRVSYNISHSEDRLNISFETEDFSIGDKTFDWIKGRIIKEGDIVRVSFIKSPSFEISGLVDISHRKYDFEIWTQWQEQRENSRGQVDVNAKLWGDFGSVFASGTLEAVNGIYYGNSYSKMIINFFGNPPELVITDSRVELKDGSVFEIVGNMDISRFKGLFPNANFVAKKLLLGDWEMMTESHSNFGIRKTVDNAFDIMIDSSEKNEDRQSAGTEVRYKLEDNEFLRLRMEKNDTMLGYEYRSEF
ncbi:MAG: hypothetical protein PHC58_03880 [Candidatus Omnitrophica bacterium]|nr:hypothetical protein [Candidatus Omnitrophota bacterium]